MITATSLVGQVRIKVSDVYSNDNLLNFNHAYLQIDRTGTIQEEYILKIYNGRKTNIEFLIGESNTFYSKKNSENVRLQDIMYISKNKLENTTENTITFLLFDAITMIQKGQYILSVVKSDTNNSSIKSNKAIDFDGNIGYQYNRNSNNVDSLNIPNYHAITLNSDVSIANIPIMMNGVWTDFGDSRYSYDVSNFTAFFDVAKWKEKQISKAKTYVVNEANTTFGQIPNYQEYAQKGNYYNKIMSDKNMISDINNLDSALMFADSLGLSDEFEVEREISLLTQELEDQRALLSDSLFHDQRDSLQSEIDKREKSINNLTQLKTLYKKKAYYDTLIDFKDSCNHILKKAEKIQTDANEYANAILNDPSQLNKRLSSIGAINRFDKVLNYVTEFRYGIIQPNYSRFAMQGSRTDGMAIGVGEDSWNVHMFKGQLSGLTALNQDSTSSAFLNELMGGKIDVSLGKNWKNSVFLISSVSSNPLINESPNSLLGYKLETGNGNSQISFDAVWSRGVNSSANSESSLMSSLRNVAFDVNYTYANTKKSIIWNTRGSIVGPEYYDFNNPFLFRDNGTVTSNISWRPSKVWTSGANIFIQKSNLWDENSVFDKRILVGTNQQINFEGLPSINYNNQFGYIHIDEKNVKTQLHTISSFYNYTIKNHNLTTIINGSFSNNDAAVDSLDMQSENFAIHQSYSFNTTLSINLGFNYYSYIIGEEARILDRSLEVSFPINYKNLSINGGLKFIGREGQTKYGWMCLARYSIRENINCTINLDSAQHIGSVDKFGNRVDTYSSRYTTGLTYNF